jgi:hypothetical protein
VEISKWIEGYRTAWEQSDDASVAELFTEGASYRSNIFEEPHVGRDAIRAYWSHATRTQSDISVQMGTPFVDGHRLAVEFWTTMRNEGDEVTLPGCLLLEFDEDGVCSSLREYWQLEYGERHPPHEWGR